MSHGRPWRRKVEATTTTTTISTNTSPPPSLRNPVYVGRLCICHFQLKTQPWACQKENIIAIVQKRKTDEGRPEADPRLIDVDVGSIIMLAGGPYWVVFRVLQKRTHNTLEDMVAACGHTRLLPYTETNEECVLAYQALYRAIPHYERWVSFTVEVLEYQLFGEAQKGVCWYCKAVLCVVPSNGKVVWWKEDPHTIDACGFRCTHCASTATNFTTTTTTTTSTTTTAVQQ